MSLSSLSRSTKKVKSNERSSERNKEKWKDMINKSVHTIDNVDIGDIEGMSRDLVIVKRGYINEHYYYIPITNVAGLDGEVLWLKVKEDDVKSKYERQINPDP
jgi:hypothetical protein